MPNPIPSTDVTDFLDNVKDFDALCNGAGSYLDRFGKSRLTVDEFFRRTGYEVPVAFASGIAVSRVTQTVTYSGVTYHALATAIPFTTTGTFNPAQWEVISGVSRQELGAEYGSSLIGAATYAQLRAYTGDATRIQIGGRSNYFDGAHGIAVRTGNKPDNGGTVWKDGLGRSWERQFSGPVNVLWWGADLLVWTRVTQHSEVPLTVCLAAGNCLARRETTLSPSRLFLVLLIVAFRLKAIPHVSRIRAMQKALF